MKNLKLILLTAAVAFFQTACGGGDKKTPIQPTATMNACWSSGGDPNNAACKAYTNAVQHPVISAEVPAAGQSQLSNATGISNPAVVKAATSGVAIASVSEASVQAQSAKIKTALASYSENPDSSYYDPAVAAAKVTTAGATPATTTATAVTPASVAPASVSRVPSSTGVLATAESTAVDGGASR